jgi:hypothetical protein
MDRRSNLSASGLAAECLLYRGTIYELCQRFSSDFFTADDLSFWIELLIKEGMYLREILTLGVMGNMCQLCRTEAWPHIVKGTNSAYYLYLHL